MQSKKAILGCYLAPSGGHFGSSVFGFTHEDVVESMKQIILSSNGLYREDETWNFGNLGSFPCIEMDGEIPKRIG